MTFGFSNHNISNGRSLTLRSVFAPVQDYIPIYTAPETFTSIFRMFPYMIDSKHATGGGDIPSFVWHSFDPSAPFTISTCGGIEVTPLPVEHGVSFSDESATPYMCMGFRIGEMSYISDTNRVPEETKQKIEGSKILILDALRETPHGSHFSFSEVTFFLVLDVEKQAKEFVLSLKPVPEITYWVGLTHQTDHYLLEQELEEWSNTTGVRIEPAYDGLQIRLS